MEKMTYQVLEKIKARRRLEAEQNKINACVVPIDKDLSEKAKNLMPACEAIRQREGLWEWAIDGTEEREWFPILMIVQKKTLTLR